MQHPPDSSMKRRVACFLSSQPFIITWPIHFFFLFRLAIEQDGQPIVCPEIETFRSLLTSCIRRCYESQVDGTYQPIQKDALMCILLRNVPSLSAALCLTDGCNSYTCANSNILSLYLFLYMEKGNHYVKYERFGHYYN